MDVCVVQGMQCARCGAGGWGAGGACGTCRGPLGLVAFRWVWSWRTVVIGRLIVCECPQFAQPSPRVAQKTVKTKQGGIGANMLRAVLPVSLAQLHAMGLASVPHDMEVACTVLLSEGISASTTGRKVGVSASMVKRLCRQVDEGVSLEAASRLFFIPFPEMVRTWRN